ncbi:uncharacterized protein TNCV_2251061 [Trichonephila clavipes]|nr:uncharacterized protein TNCV_2251061 [Trichonephila clavipes]
MAKCVNKTVIIKELWFQQDGATCHTARATIDLLKDTFGDRLISRFGPVNWLPRSCDLTPLDYFVWSYVKSLVYADKPQTLHHLEDNIRRVIADIRPQMLENAIENWTISEPARASAVQFESDILVTVLKNILKTEWRDERLKYYSWHMVLQAIIKKFFIIEDPRLSYSKYSITFKYPFVDSNAMPQTGSQELADDFTQSPLFDVYKILLKHLFSFSLSSVGNVCYNKVILHAYKTIFKMLRRLKTSEKNVVRELFVLNTLLKQCCFEKEFKDAINSFKTENSFIMHYYTTASWKIPGEYLLFILCNYWNETLKILSEKDDTPLSSLADCFPSYEERNCLINICSLYSDQFEENDFCTKTLKCIITCNYPCATSK